MSTMKPQYVWIQIIQNYLGFIPSDLKKGVSYVETRVNYFGPHEEVVSFPTHSS